MVFVALQIVRYNPDTGECLGQLNLPVSKVTSCCWAGVNHDELIVTSERLVKVIFLNQNLHCDLWQTLPIGCLCCGHLNFEVKSRVSICVGAGTTCIDQFLKCQDYYEYLLGGDCLVFYTGNWSIFLLKRQKVTAHFKI